MPIEYTVFYTRTEIKANPDKLYVFGDNFEQKGFGGQAKEARDEPNSIGIPTKRRPSFAESAYLTDNDYAEWWAITEPALNRIDHALKNNRIVVFPEAGVGTGLAELSDRAPKIYGFILDFMGEITNKYGEDGKPSLIK